jgi:hypothetical protein
LQLSEITASGAVAQGSGSAKLKDRGSEPMQTNDALTLSVCCVLFAERFETTRI